MTGTGSRNDPFLNFRYEVRLDDMAVAGFSEVSGLDVVMTTMAYAEGGVNTFTHTLPGPTKQSNITLKRGIIDGSLWQWYSEMLSGKIQYRNGSIAVKDPSGAQETIRIDFYRAIPVKWSGPSLNASQSQVAVETLELAHQGLSW